MLGGSDGVPSAGCFAAVVVVVGSGCVAAVVVVVGSGFSAWAAVVVVEEPSGFAVVDVVSGAAVVEVVACVPSDEPLEGGGLCDGALGDVSAGRLPAGALAGSVTFRTRLFLLSAIQRLPSLSRFRSCMVWNCASSAGAGPGSPGMWGSWPSGLVLPLPAMVLIFPDGTMRRMRAGCRIGYRAFKSLTPCNRGNTQEIQHFMRETMNSVGHYW